MRCSSKHSHTSNNNILCFYLIVNNKKCKIIYVNKKIAKLYLYENKEKYRYIFNARLSSEFFFIMLKVFCK